MDIRITRYINERYQRWLDYAKYHCELAKIPDQAGDVLNEVLINVLSKNEKKLIGLYERRKQRLKNREIYRELDYYILQMIKLNTHSKTSPYQYRYRQVSIDDNIEFHCLEIEDEVDNSVDTSGNIFYAFQRIRKIFNELDISEREREIFKWRFFLDNSFSNWKGPEKLSELYGTFNKVKFLIINKLKESYVKNSDN